MSTILITGASSGIGAEMARQFAALGHDLALAARRLDRLDALRREISRGAHPEVRVTVWRLDVTDDDAVFDVFRAVADDFGSLDRVVINAGISTGSPVGTGGYEGNRATAMTNFVAVLAQAEAALEIMRAQEHGHLVFMSSFSALRGFTRSLTVYAATKAAVSNLAEGLRSEMQGAGLDIQVTTILPGFIRTELTESIPDAPFMVDVEDGARAIVAAIEAKKASALVPNWPWRPLAEVFKRAPLGVVRRLS